MTRRVAQLERHFIPTVDENVQNILRTAHLLWERRRQRAEADGLPFNAPPPELRPGPYLSPAEMLRRKREEHRLMRLNAANTDQTT